MVSRKYEEMMGLLQRYSKSVYEEWARGPGQDCQFSPEQPLLQRDPESRLLSVNFSRKVGAGPGGSGLPEGQRLLLTNLSRLWCLSHSSLPSCGR